MTIRAHKGIGTEEAGQGDLLPQVEVVSEKGEGCAHKRGDYGNHCTDLILDKPWLHPTIC